MPFITALEAEADRLSSKASLVHTVSYKPARATSEILFQKRLLTIKKKKATT